MMPEREVLRAMIASRNSPELKFSPKQGSNRRGWTWRSWLKYRAKPCKSWRKKLVLADFDVVEPSNLNRQQYFVRHIGLKRRRRSKS
ncbi:hypothetical protein VB002_00145 [Campylobacter concisus]